MKELKFITDEHAIEVARLMGVNDADFYTDQFSKYRTADVLDYSKVGRAYIDYVLNNGERVWTGSLSLVVKMTDYLRQFYNIPNVYQKENDNG